MHDMVLKSSPQNQPRQSPLTTKETDRVQLNLSTTKQDNLQELASLKLFELLRQAGSASAAAFKKEGTSFSNVRLGLFQAETVY